MFLKKNLENFVFGLYKFCKVTRKINFKRLGFYKLFLKVLLLNSKFEN